MRKANLLGIPFASGDLDDPAKTQTFHAPGVLEAGLSVLDAAEQELDVLAFTPVIVALQFASDRIPRRKHQQIQQPLRFRFHVAAQRI